MARFVMMVLVGGFCSLAVYVPLSIAADQKKDVKVMGSDKKTGGEAPGDREKMETIQSDTQKLKDKYKRK